jgi:hypothetical protein
MKLGKAWENRDLFSAKASDITRQLAFSGIAALWIFKSTSANTPQIPGDLVFPLFMLVLALAMDFAQYVAGSLEWHIFIRNQEKGRSATKEEDDIADAPDWLNWPHEFFFWLKVVVLLTGYVFLVIALGNRL